MADARVLHINEQLIVLNVIEDDRLKLEVFIVLVHDIGDGFDVLR